jgi:GNAT superfamily N-acetyltransferase
LTESGWENKIYKNVLRTAMLKEINKEAIDLSILKSMEDKVCYNIMHTICRNEDVLAYASEARDILAVQNPGLQMWVWTSKAASEIVKRDYFSELLKLTDNQDKMRMVCSPENYSLIAELAGRMYSSPPEQEMLLVAYWCPEPVQQGKVEGKMVPADSSYVETAAEFLSGFDLDCFGKVESAESQLLFVQSLIDKGLLYFWMKDGRPVSMAGTTIHAPGLARISRVYTPPELRGKGYARMLMTELSRKVISAGLVPMLFADAANPASNSVYLKCGYRKAGLMQEFLIIRR